MWISDIITNNSKERPAPEKGMVNMNADGTVQIHASSDFGRAVLAAPYGIVYSPPGGESSVVMNAGGESVCLGMICPKNDLQPGELRLFSAGGATLELKNDGKVYINGRVVR